MSDGEPEVASRTIGPLPWRAVVRGARGAIVTLTRLPVGGFPYADDEWRWSSAWLPLVGACLGAILSLVWIAFHRAGDGVAAVVTTCASLVLTGAMHEDGLADTADALGGGLRDRARILSIMKDSRIGTYGAAALTSSLALRVALLVRFGNDAPWTLLLAECASRLVPVWLMHRLDYVSDLSSQKHAVMARAAWPQLLVALATTLVVTVPAAWSLVPSPLGPCLVCAVVALTALGAERWFRRRLDGFTGDTLGAAQQLTWVAVSCAFALVRGPA